MTASVPSGRIRSFFSGVGDLLRGFGYWGRLPRAMALGIIPAAIVGLVLLAGLITLAVLLRDLVDGLTGFADTWAPLGADLVRFGIGAAILGGAVVLAVVSFTALTLLVGDPFYERIWRAVETDLGDPAPESEYGFWRSVGDSVSLILRGLLAAIVAGLVGLIPAVGGVLGAVTAAFLTGWLLADELTSRALTARRLDAGARRRVRRGHRARVLGFGVATQLCFLIPLGAVVAMPAAVAGSTLLARRMLDTTAADTADTTA
ncbi:EI24 domain-containing protein [Microbacterium sp. EYE_5]|uniref:EI24 domain-containing protein n=1 Tax=unclassified Microbacterium TaxID=2609290 RepID=UPI002004F530|nr:MULTISPECIES: EI24 domain-containing protein [unclassified Microbacterium]MCK6079512.1 EI24 domain-containing protein [Microbacterium sp. EYE_382]MCK6084782.1 EI24 domain-containing protein [Microbacterium sp. EYE_384]MCK6122991.1 EI24 domain-containing protein [Microbacterium sp. EYE_80]MCK6125546.1 EI24 domain-containing protein [Microbacterium sp. EYE_79]MCK6140466.1 EI24 domain-containing protein [Microbacterium sp. EYE_39]